MLAEALPSMSRRSRAPKPNRCFCRHLIQGLGPYFVANGRMAATSFRVAQGAKAPAGEILGYYTTLRRLFAPPICIFPGVWYNRGEVIC